MMNNEATIRVDRTTLVNRDIFNVLVAGLQ